ncbi:hypothetical protein JCM8547_001598 [Rhodosporidiobolus lusitaniae]
MANRVPQNHRPQYGLPHDILSLLRQRAGSIRDGLARYQPGEREVQELARWVTEVEGAFAEHWDEWNGRERQQALQLFNQQLERVRSGEVTSVEQLAPSADFNNAHLTFVPVSRSAAPPIPPVLHPHLQSHSLPNHTHGRPALNPAAERALLAASGQIFPFSVPGIKLGVTHPWPSQLASQVFIQPQPAGGLQHSQRGSPTVIQERVQAPAQQTEEPDSGDEDEAAMAAHQIFGIEPPAGTYERAERSRRRARGRTDSRSSSSSLGSRKASRSASRHAAAHHSPAPSSSLFDRAGEGDDENAFAPRFGVDRVLE